MQRLWIALVVMRAAPAHADKAVPEAMTGPTRTVFSERCRALNADWAPKERKPCHRVATLRKGRVHAEVYRRRDIESYDYYLALETDRGWFTSTDAMNVWLEPQDPKAGWTTERRLLQIDLGGDWTRGIELEATILVTKRCDACGTKDPIEVDKVVEMTTLVCGRAGATTCEPATTRSARVARAYEPFDPTAD